MPDGRLARFYELQTNRPLFFDLNYQLTYASDNMPKHYGFIVKSEIPKLRKEYEQVSQGTLSELRIRKLAKRNDRSSTVPTESEVRSIIESLDARGDWVEPGTLKYHKGRNDVVRVIKSETFITNLNALSQYVASKRKILAAELTPPP